jgi:hypothetical protein
MRAPQGVAAFAADQHHQYCFLHVHTILRLIEYY